MMCLLYILQEGPLSAGVGMIVPCFSLIATFNLVDVVSSAPTLLY